MQPERLGTYAVEREIGRGGMGVVYLARDPRLNRQVAIKVVPDSLAQNPENLARFEREARLLAAVNHPNIASIYSIEQTETGQRLLVMEYVPGESLSDRLRRGALSIDEALECGRQVAAAVEAAHEASIVHRDLKPGNIRITESGLVKVLDFGLGKFVEGTEGAEGMEGSLANSPTLTARATQLGIIIGTAAYMAPEQARGKAVDRRTDVWAFGCVLFESLAGRKIFEGETVSDTIARVLEREPDWSALPAATPPRIRELLRRCLEKDLKKRQRDIGDVRLELDEAIALRSSATRSIELPAPHAPERQGRVGRFARTALVAVAGAAVGVALWTIAWGGWSPAPADVLQLSITVPANFTVAGVSPTMDGRGLLLRGNFRRPDGTDNPIGRLFLRRLDSYALTPIDGTEGLELFARAPDSRWVAILKPVRPGSPDRQIFRVSLDGTSPATAIADWSPEWQDLHWLSTNELLTLDPLGGRFIRIPLDGGQPIGPTPFTDGALIGFPRINSELPDGRGVLLRSEQWGARGYQQDIWHLDPVSGKTTRLLENASSGRYLPDLGHLLFARGTSILAVTFDPKTLAVGATPTPLYDGLRASSWSNGHFIVTPQGHLFFEPGGRLGLDRRIVAVAPDRSSSAFVDEARPYENAFAVSPDGRLVAMVIPDARGTYEIWAGGVDRPGLRRVVPASRADALLPQWSPDGQWIAYTRTGRDADDGIYVQRSDGSGQPKLLLKARTVGEGVAVTEWTSTGLIAARRTDVDWHVLMVPLGPGLEPGTPRLLRDTRGVAPYARPSPDGQLIAFHSTESGRERLHVASFQGDVISGFSVPASGDAAFEPRWSRDSQRLYFRETSGRIMSVSVSRNPLRVSTPALFHDLRALRLIADGWAVLPDGRLLGIRMGEGEGDPTAYNLILNWLPQIAGRLK